MHDLSMDKTPKISFKAKVANPEGSDDVDEFKKRFEFARFQKCNANYELKKMPSREKGSFIEP